MILTLGFLAACQDKKPEPAPPPPPHDGVTLISPGSAPLQLLRYHLIKGTKTHSELVWEMTAVNDGQNSPMPTLVIDLETSVDDVLPDGTAKLRITVVRTTVRDQKDSGVASDLVRDEVAAMRGIVLTEALAPDGKLSDSRLDTGATLPESARSRLDSLLRTLEQAAMRLPAEPVGVGATWRERKSLPAGGIRAVSETTYALTSLADTRLSYTGDGAATGEPQTIEQDGVKVEVTSTRGSSGTRGTIDLARYAPELTVHSTFSTAMNVVAATPAPGAGPSTVEITMAIQVTSRDASAAAGEAAPSDAGLAPDAERQDGQGAHSAP
ncbi:MAG TPA: hypothetical protein VFK02_25165 [Kofleriaceae bacterium]|nr:hypothetical protein [Kofleriaceae bacterium]